MNFKLQTGLSIAKSVLAPVFALGIIVCIGWFIYWVASSIWRELSSLNPTLAVSLIAASATIIASTLAVVAGRYLERKKEREALYRDKKIAMYDEVLVKLFELFREAQETDKGQKDLVPFLRELHRKLILWSGPGVIRAYVDWHQLLTRESGSGKAVVKMEDFFKAIRADLGHSNWGIKQGDFIRFVLRNTDLFMQAYRTNPNITLHELVELEKLVEKNQKQEMK